MDFKQVLYIGTHPEGRGGMASVMKMYASFAGDDFRFICTHRESAKIEQAARVVFSAILLICYCLFVKIKIIHIHTASYHAFFRDSIYLLIAKLFKKKVILHLHGGKFESFYDEHPSYCRFICHNADCVVAVSSYFRSLFERLRLNSNICVLYNAIDPPLFMKDNQFRQIKNITFMGAINANKGIYDILDCWKTHKDFFSHNVILHICGVGEEEKVSSFIGENALDDLVLYHGWLNRDAKNRLFAMTDIYLQPSYFESLGISILEAMSYSIPIIASNTGGIPDLVSDGENGYLIQPGDVESIFACIQSLIEDPVMMRRMGACSYKRSQNFFPERIKCEVVELYKSIL